MSYIFGLLLVIITIGVGVVGLSILDDLLKEVTNEKANS